MGEITGGTALFAAAVAAAVLVLAAAIGRMRGIEKGARLSYESEQRLRGILNTVGEGIVTIDEAGCIQSFNRAAEKMFGYRSEEVVGRDIVALLPVPEGSNRDDHVNQCLLVADERTELIGKRKDGSRFPVEYSAGELLQPDGIRIVGVLKDVSDEKRMQDALVDSEQRFKDLAEVSSDWFWETGPDLRFTFVSVRVRHALGVNTAFFIGKTFGDFAAASEEPAHWSELLNDVAARRNFRGFVFKQALPDGRVKYLKISGRPVFDRHGIYCGYRGTGTDITSEVEAQAKAKEAQHQLIAALETINEGFALWDEEDRLILFNSKLREIFSGCPVRTGVRFEELIRSMARLGDAAHAEGRQEDWVAEQLAHHRLRKGAAVELPTRSRWFLVSEQRTPDNHIVGVYTDITTLKHREQEIARRTAMSQAIIDNMPQGISVFDAEHRLVALNDTARRLLRVPDAVRPGERFTTFIATLSANGEFGDAAAGLALEKEILAHVHRDLPCVSERTRPDGTSIEIRCNAMPDGGFLVSYSDITEHKQVEETLLRAKEAAERGSRAKAAFLASVSHELRTPLNAIIGFSEAILGELFGPLGHPRYRDYMHDIYESGNHLLNLINDILDISKAEAGKIELDESDIDLSVIVAQSIRMLSKRADNAKIDLVVNIPPDLPRLRADMRRLRQILLNLVSNALKFTEEGGRITVSAELVPEGIVIRVEDTGIGMQPEEIDKAMEPFVQVDSSLSRRYEGTGLGLPLTKKLVEAHGGTFTLESRYGEGTTVTILLPPERAVGPTPAE